LTNFIPYGKQNIDENDINEVVRVLKSDFLTQGPLVGNFEEKICHRLKSKYAIAVNSATSALHIACMAIGIGENDIVWTSPNSFVASANCALYCGARVDFVDIDLKTGLISIEKLTAKLKEASVKDKLPSLLIPVHLCGASCDMEAISKLSHRYGFKILEDASHALGGKYKENYVGSCKYSDITVFSFHPVKIITTGEGGVATTNNKDYAEKLYKLRSHGIEKNHKNFYMPTDKPWIYEQQLLGYNYRMTDIHAALGISQFNKLDQFVKERNFIFKRYKELFESLDFISFLEVKDNVYSSFHLAVLILNDNAIPFHKEIFLFLRKSGIGVQIHYIPIHCQPYYKSIGFTNGDFPNAENYANRAISIPIYPGLTLENQNYIFDKFKEIKKFFKIPS
tara:strand:+ start:753 stop:1937 length:1185 start_codon:yes stop_codon:yes gene_type:complete